MKSLLFICITVFMVSLGCGQHKNSPENIAAQYLSALKNKDWDKAKQYAEESAQQEIDCMNRMNADWGLTDVKDVRCIIDDKTAKCSFCCSKEETENINLVKDNGIWKVTGHKEICPDEVDE